jgi:outer membrane protein OmpA-like peptidoglycan-associated protein
MSGLVGAFVLVLVGVLVVQMDLVASLQAEVQKRQVEEQRRMALEKALAIPLASGRVTLNDGRIGISGSVLFPVNSDQLRGEGRQLLKSLVHPLRVYLGERNEMLMVSGFTDDKPISEGNRRFADNLELSAQRALTVTRALIEEGMPSSQVFAAAFGAEQPVASNQRQRRARPEPARGDGAGAEDGERQDGRTIQPGAMTQHGASLQDSIESLRRDGAWRIDPVRFRYLEALARRIPGQPDSVRQLLEAKLQAALADYAARFAAQPIAAAALPVEGEATACVPLVQLNHHIRGLRPLAAAADPFGVAQDPHELDSVRRFRRAWSSSRTQDQLEHAVSRKPVNAGPLNSHALVLHSLALMADLSPDYLRRFLAQVETLQWLERAAQAQRPAPGKASRRKAVKKPPAG